LGAPTNKAATQDWPYDPASSATKTETRIWEKKVDESVRKKAYLDKNLETQYSLVRGSVLMSSKPGLRLLMDTKTSPIRGTPANKGLIYNFQSQK
jgi:hypothetical protein